MLRRARQSQSIRPRCTTRTATAGDGGPPWLTTGRMPRATAGWAAAVQRSGPRGVRATCVQPAQQTASARARRGRGERGLVCALDAVAACSGTEAGPFGSGTEAGPFGADGGRAP